MGCVIICGDVGPEQALVQAAAGLGARGVAGWSAAEQRLADAAAGPRPRARLAGSAETGEAWPGDISEIRAQILAGEDPLGDAFCRIRPPAQRRPSGQIFTPRPLVESMIGWAAGTVRPARVVDPGAGSARFLVAAGRRWPDAGLIGVETDPLAAMIARATLAAAGMAGRAEILLSDYRSLALPRVAGPTLFLGNPPYVRHHQLGARWKDWLRSTAATLGLPASGLSGLHVHFFLATTLHAVPGDAGALVTAAEWLDVNYGGLVRSLLLGPLGGQAVHLLDPAVPVFADAAATAAITCFLPGRPPETLRLRHLSRLDDLGDLSGGAVVPATVLRAAARWTPLLTQPAPHQAGGGPPSHPGRGVQRGHTGRGGWPAGHVELGELCRVHRGQVTGANKVWITTGNPAGLPGRYLFPAVTRASELFQAEGTLATASRLRLVIDLPADLDELSAAELALITRFLAQAEAAGAARCYIASHRTPWWRVRLRAPAPILASYMARRPPTFVRNLAGARHVNIAHGLYPVQPLSPLALDGLAAFLRRSVAPGQGRTYAGGLTKFEPGEMERLPVPAPDTLPGYAPAAAGT
jgi:adenine-specific DNA-methyltransferase